MKLKKVANGILGIFIFIWVFINIYQWIECKKIFKEFEERKKIHMKNFDEAEKEMMCYELSTATNGLKLFNAKDDIDYSKRYIFFHETSCYGHDNVRLNPRQACAIESTAKMNPDMIIMVFFLSPWELNGSTKVLFNSLLEYKNIRFRRLVIREYVKNSPLIGLYSSGKLAKSKWIKPHMSDFLRCLSLWKFGGIYIDLDFVIMASLKNMTDFASAEGSNYINNAFMGFSNSEIGRRLIDEYANYLNNNYRTDVWTANGPEIITNLAQNLCQTNQTSQMTPDRCEGFTIYQESVVYPIPYQEWKKYFEVKNEKETMKLIKNSHGIHLWNKLSYDSPVPIDSNVPYAQIARKYCPISFNSVDKYF